jgi:hypothetical protein
VVEVERLEAQFEDGLGLFFERMRASSSKLLQLTVSPAVGGTLFSHMLSESSRWVRNLKRLTAPTAVSIIVNLEEALSQRR